MQEKYMFQTAEVHGRKFLVLNEGRKERERIIEKPKGNKATHSIDSNLDTGSQGTT